MNTTMTRANEMRDHIRITLSSMYNRTMHEDIYRIMDALGDDALPSLANLVGKIDKMCRADYGLKQENKRLKEKTQRMWK